MEALNAAGSNRRYYRLTSPDGQTMIGVEGTNMEENRAFVEIARCFATHNLPTPRVLAEDAAHLVYLQEDLGNVSLFDTIRHGRENGGHYSDAEEQLLHATIRELPRLQFEGIKGLDIKSSFSVSRLLGPPTELPKLMGRAFKAPDTALLAAAAPPLCFELPIIWILLLTTSSLGWNKE